MKPLVWHEAIAGALLGISAAVWAAGELAMRVRSRGRGRTAPELTFLVIGAAVTIGILGAAVASHRRLAPLPGSAWWPVALGLLLLYAGALLRLWAMVALGRFFKAMVVIQEDHRLVQRGPYRRLRHPSYAGGLAGLTGLGIALGDWLATAWIVALVGLGMLIRIRVEERALLGALGEEYARYMQRTWRLVPGVW